MALGFGLRVYLGLGFRGLRGFRVLRPLNQNPLGGFWGVFTGLFVGASSKLLQDFGELNLQSSRKTNQRCILNLRNLHLQYQ